MKLRCDLHVNGGARKLVLVPAAHETAEHLGLKLASYLLFWDLNPVVGASPRHPALAGQEFAPDLMALDDAGAVRLWVECGKVTLHKLGKLTRRLPGTRLVVLKASENEAQRLRLEMKERLDRGDAVEILAWPGGQFGQWMEALQDKTEIYGEAGARTLNIVVNERPLVAELKAF